MAGDDRGDVLRLLGRAEIDAGRLSSRRKAAAYAHVTLCAAMVGDEGRMARCLEQVERYRRNLPLLQQVNVCALLCRASLTVGAREFAQVMAAMAADCACRIRSRGYLFSVESSAVGQPPAAALDDVHSQLRQQTRPRRSPWLSRARAGSTRQSTFP